jgi:hypothetical protein
MGELTALNNEESNLTTQEQTFCMAVLEFGGNLAAAYRSVYGTTTPNALPRAQLMIARPEIAKRINEISAIVNEHTMISLGSHLQELAEIRDLSKSSGQLRTALAAEKYRGEVIGLYKKPDETHAERAPAVHIHLGHSTPVSVQEWSQRQGVKPVIIENGAS